MEVNRGQIYARARSEQSRRKHCAALLGPLHSADPAWDFLIDLYLSKQSGGRLSVTDLGIGASVPSTTALRWLALLESRDLVKRAPDKRDKRRIHIALTEAGQSLIETIFTETEGENTDGTLTIKITRTGDAGARFNLLHFRHQGKADSG